MSDVTDADRGRAADIILDGDAVPDPANLDQLAADAVITFQVSMVGPRMVSGLPVFDTMPWEEREVWREYVRAILRDEVPPGNFPEQAKAWQDVARMVRREVVPMTAAEPTP